MNSRAIEAFANVRSEITSWLFEQALPLWSTVGTDHISGGFFEKISRSGEAVIEPRRTRVVGRQIYVFATAGKLGWSGPVDHLVAWGLDYFLKCCLAADGHVISVSQPDGTIVKADFDLYDHAFSLFGLAAAARVRDDADKLSDIARRMRLRMKEGWAHPIRGFEEAVPRRLPLLSNPHMHMFEASLAWLENGGCDEGNGWSDLADEIGALCLEKFLHPQIGCLREFFDGEWSAMSGDEGRIVEPGHQFEWAWLLIRWGKLRGRSDAIEAARRLVAIAEEFGVDPLRGVAFNEIWDDFSARDRRARLWPQTERIKAWLAMASVAENADERDVALNKATQAAFGLKKYFAQDVVGSWNERMCEDGSFLVEPAPASSLYHIVCAVAEMHLIPISR